MHPRRHVPKQISEVWTDNLGGITFCEMGFSHFRQPHTPPLTVIVLYMLCVVSEDVGVQVISVGGCASDKGGCPFVSDRTTPDASRSGLLISERFLELLRANPKGTVVSTREQ